MSSPDALPRRGPWPFKAEPVVLLITALIALSVPVQYFWLPDEGFAGALSAESLRQGRWWTLFTYMLLHGGVLHAAMNGLAALTLGRAARRFFARGPKGGFGFLLFYVAGGLLAGLGYVALHPSGNQPAVGASGALFALWGAFARATPWPGEVGRWWSPQMRAQLQGAVISNVIVIVAGAALSGGLIIAWEAHVAGFIAGAVLIGPFTRIFGRVSGPWDLPEREI